MKNISLKFLLACSGAMLNINDAATLHESSFLSQHNSYWGGTVRVPADDLAKLQRLVAHITSNATPASPVVSEKKTTPSAINVITAEEVRSSESSMDGINFHNKDISFRNSKAFLEEIERFVTKYQAAKRTDPFVIDLSKNFIDGGFLESLLTTLEPIKKHVSELRLHQNKLYLRSIEQLAPLLRLDGFKYLTVYGNFIGTERLLAFGAGIYDEDADDGYDAAYLTPEELLQLPIEQRRICVQKMIWIPKAYFKDNGNPTNVPTVDGLISSDEILRIHREYFGLPALN